MEEDINGLFHKKYSFSKPTGGWQLPPVSVLFKEKTAWKVCFAAIVFSTEGGTIGCLALNDVLLTFCS